MAESAPTQDEPQAVVVVAIPRGAFTGQIVSLVITTADPAAIYDPGVGTGFLPDPTQYVNVRWTGRCWVVAAPDE